MRAFTLLQYHEAGCPITHLCDSVKFCDSDYECEVSFRNGSGCVARTKLLAMRPLSATNVVFSESVANEAKRLNLSKSEVRRIRSGAVPINKG